MSHTSPEQGFENDSLQQKLLQHFADAASAVLSQIAGSSRRTEFAALESAPPQHTNSRHAGDPHAEAATLLRLDISGAIDGACELALSTAMTAQFASLLTGGPATDASESQEAAAELMQQICGNAADRLRAAFGPLELKTLAQASQHQAPRGTGGGNEASADAAGPRQLFRIHGGDDSPDDVSLEFELHVLRLAKAAHTQVEADEDRAAQSAAVSASGSLASPLSACQGVKPSAAPIADASSAQALTGNRNLDLLLDFELGVTLRFGSRQMLLKDVLELSSGSVVELDRRVEEPVDMLIDGRVIAQGEVVIIGGNYGLRILRVATQGEKLACLP